MPITVYYNNNTEEKCTIRPTPLISVNSDILKNGAGEAFGVTYTISLNGQIIANEGTPYAFKTNSANEIFKVYSDSVGVDATPSSLCGPYCSFDKARLFDRPPTQMIPKEQALGAILSKQKSLRALFALDGQRVEITDWTGLDKQSLETEQNPVLIFYPRITSVSFEEGIYTDTCSYNISMEADVLLSNTDNSTDQTNFQVDIDTTLLTASSGWPIQSGVNGIEKIVEEYKIIKSCNVVATEEEGEEVEEVEEGEETETTFDLTQITESALKDFNQSFISDFSEEWSIEVDEQFGENHRDTPLQSNSENTSFRDLIQPKSYIISHSLSAVGKTHYGPEGKTEAWKEAQKFVKNRMINETNTKPSGSVLTDQGYPNIYSTTSKDYQQQDDGTSQVVSVEIPGFFGSGALNLANHFKGFNHTRNENISISDGSYSVEESWLIASGTDYENYSMSITSDNQNPFINVSIQGKIKGLSSLSPSSVYFGGQYNDHKLIEDADKRDPRFLVSPYTNALDKWYKISRSGVFGYTSDIYRRANSTIAVELNSQPLDISLGMNEYAGEIDYSLSFDNRPTNIISGTLFENIDINETYPGDVFAVIPVIGRKTGPILQYNGSRTSYSRDLNIDLIMDSNKIPYETGRKMLIRRPSAINPTASQLESLIHELSPQHEPGIRKYFHDPPQESWNPKTGQYSFSISWTYELDK